MAIHVGVNPADEAAAASPHVLRRVDRQLGWMVAVCGTLLVLGVTLGQFRQNADFAPWWNVGGFALVGAVLAAAVGGRSLPFPAVRTLWVAVPILGWGLLATSAVAADGLGPGVAVPWIWSTGPVLVAFTVLWLKPLPVLVGAVGTATLPALSAALAGGSVPPDVVATVPVQMGGLGAAVLLMGIRTRLVRMAAGESRLQALEERRLRTQIEIEQRRQLATLVHDEVLSVLGAAVRFVGPPPDAVRAEAARALQMIEEWRQPGDAVRLDIGIGGPRTSPPSYRPDRAVSPVPVDTVADQLIALTRTIDPQATVAVHRRPGSVPDVVVLATASAMAEVLRNSLRHAGSQACRRVRAEVSPEAVVVIVSDDGVGFDLSEVDGSRFGLRYSVRERMASIPGGYTRIRATPGAGVSVEMGWQR